MNPRQKVYYRLAPGIDVVPVGDGSVVFRSDTLSIRLEGKSSGLFVERVLPLLDGRHDLSELAAELPDVAIDELTHYLETLVQSRVLHRAEYPQEPQSIEEQTLAPFLTMLDMLGMSTSSALERLGQLRIAVIGLEGHGAHLATILARCGIGSIVLIDPYPCRLGNLALMPFVNPDAVGNPRQDVLKAAMQAQGLTTEILIHGSKAITYEHIAALVPDCHMLAGCFDKGFSTTNHWINQVSIKHGVPAIYAESRGHIGLVGPLVLPGQTACYMCYRMRNIACAKDFDQAMSYEEFLDQQRQPLMHTRGVFPALLSCIASLLALDILKHLLSLGQPSLAGTVFEFDAISFRTLGHDVLRVPNCPVCCEKKKRRHPSISELARNSSSPGDLLKAAPRLVSDRTGIVKNFRQVQKDVSEPAHPYIFRAELANHRFLNKEDDRTGTCSGKGMTIGDAQISALGEAVERYAAACWDYDEVYFACRGDLNGDTLDPRRLVLYRPDQYERLPYVPYEEESTLGWILARSLVTGNSVYVPALAVYMSYEVQSPQEFICPITSNGLAAGPTLLNAILKATFEVLERDAYMITWLNQLPCQRVDPRGHPDADMVELCEAYGRRNVRMYLYQLPTEHPCSVFLSLGVQEGGLEGPAAVVGLGADMDPCRAARQAILEVAQVRPALRRRMRHPETRHRMEELAANPHLVAELEDHDLVYASQKSLGAFDFLLERPLTPFRWKSQTALSPTVKMRRLVEHLRDREEDLIYYNLTSPDMIALGLHTVRVILPGYQPIHFGWNERRLGGERLYRLPYQLGFTTSPATVEQLNPSPHPLA